jgi:ATP-dependent DNA ligase
MKAQTPPSGGVCLHKIKRDGFRVVARKDGAKVRRPGNDLTYRFPLIVESVARLRCPSCRHRLDRHCVSSSLGNSYRRALY